MTNRTNIVIAFVFICCPIVIYCQGILESQVYISLPDSRPCTKWMNSTHQVGCTSKSGGVSGLLYLLETKDEIDRFNTSERQSIIAVIKGELFSLENIKKLEKWSTGIIVLDDGSKPKEGHSDDLKHPNSNEDTFVWNPLGDASLFRLFKIPMWLTSEEEAKTVKSLALSNKVNSTIWGAQLTQFMHASENAVECLELGYCEPVGGHSIWTSLPSPISDKTKLIFSLSSLDSISIFHGKAIGAVSEMSSLIANLVALEALTSPGNGVVVEDFKKQIVFAFFEGESFGYVGSSRFIKDILEFECQKPNDDGTCSLPKYSNTDFTKITLENIDTILELKQVGTKQSEDEVPRKLYIHNYDDIYDHPTSNKLLEISQSIVGLELLYREEDIIGLPPSSSLSFLKYKDSLKDKTFVISDHASAFSNKFYHSHFDDFENLDIETIKKSAALLANTLFELAMDGEIENETRIIINETLVAELAFCLTKNISCDLISYVLNDTRVNQNTVPSHYPGPFFVNSISYTSKFVHDFVALNLNHTRDANCTSCEGVNENCIAGYCISSYVNYHEAYSTGLKRDYETGKYSVIDENEPNWVESYWTPIGLRLYYSGSNSKEAIFLVYSVIQVTAFAGLCMFFKRNCMKRFKTL